MRTGPRNEVPKLGQHGPNGLHGRCDAADLDDDRRDGGPHGEVSNGRHDEVQYAQYDVVHGQHGVGNGQPHS